jgi:hypothetical protein
MISTHENILKSLLNSFSLELNEWEGGINPIGADKTEV